METVKKILQTEIDRNFEITIENCVRRVLKEMNSISNQINPNAVERDFCFIAEASIITGLAESTIRSKCNLSQMPHFKPKGTKMLQFKRSELNAWTESGRVKTTDEMEQETDEYLTSKKQKK